MIRITAYRVINGNTVTHKSRKRKHVKTLKDVERYERNTAARYQRKTGSECEVWAIYITL